MSHIYSGEKTIHRNAQLDVEVDKNGIVVAVWYNCQVLPFRQSDIDDRRAEDMRSLYAAGDDTIPDILAIEVDSTP